MSGQSDFVVSEAPRFELPPPPKYSSLLTSQDPTVWVACVASNLIAKVIVCCESSRGRERERERERETISYFIFLFLTAG